MTALTLLVDGPHPQRHQGARGPGCTVDQTAAGPRPAPSCESYGMPSTQSFASWGATGTGTAIFLVDTLKYSNGKFHAGGFVGNVAVPLVLSVLTSVGRVASATAPAHLRLREPDPDRRRLADRLRHGRPPRPRLHASSSAPTAATATASSAGEAPQSAEHRLPHHRLPNRKPQRPGPARSLAPLSLRSRLLALRFGLRPPMLAAMAGETKGFMGGSMKFGVGEELAAQEKERGPLLPLRLLVLTDLVPASAYNAGRERARGGAAGRPGALRRRCSPGSARASPSRSPACSPRGAPRASISRRRA